MFVGMLGFFMSFFEFESAACSKKRHAKTVWPFLFCEGFRYQKNSFYQLTQDTMTHDFSGIDLNRTFFYEIRG